MFEFHVLAIFAATFLAVAIGVIWYSPWVFGPLWLHITGVTASDVELPGHWKRMLLASMSQLCLFFFGSTLNRFEKRSSLNSFRDSEGVDEIVNAGTDLRPGEAGFLRQHPFLHQLQTVQRYL